MSKRYVVVEWKIGDPANRRNVCRGSAWPFWLIDKSIVRHYHNDPDMDRIYLAKKNGTVTYEIPFSTAKP